MIVTTGLILVMMIRLLSALVSPAFSLVVVSAVLVVGIVIIIIIASLISIALLAGLFGGGSVSWGIGPVGRHVCAAIGSEGGFLGFFLGEGRR